LLGLGLSFSFLILYTVVRTPWTGDQPVSEHKQNINTQISMLPVGFKPTISVLERAKAVHVLDRAATVIGTCIYHHTVMFDELMFLLRAHYFVLLKQAYLFEHTCHVPDISKTNK
jgi:hypothetical protein